MRFAIIGGRDFDDYEYMKEILDKIRLPIHLITSGGAKGADSLGEKYADDNNIDKVIFKPDWERFGRSAGFVRNKQIVDNCDIVIAFWDGKSKGTKHSIDYAVKRNKFVKVYDY